QNKNLKSFIYFPDGVIFSTCLLLQPVYHFVNKSLNWTEAQTYCRQTHTDLATFLSSDEKNLFANLFNYSQKYRGGEMGSTWFSLKFWLQKCNFPLFCPHWHVFQICSGSLSNLFINTLSSAGHTSDVWIGLFSEIDWRWSDGLTGSGADYRHWKTSSSEPSFDQPDELCVSFHYDGGWITERCPYGRYFLCYKGKY
uniref:C-type lectin domain-containing protein n=2 Tax=Poecilia TaxID=8080 RepID=A0A3B3V3Q9_9TELE